MSKVKGLVTLALILSMAFVIWAALESAQSRKVADETNPEKAVADQWTVISRNVGQEFNQIQFIDQSNGWGMSSHTLWRTSDGGQTWLEVKRAPTVKLLANHQPQAVFWKMQFLSLTEGWLLEGQDLLHTVDGGASWKKPELDSDLVKSFGFLDREHGWIVGASQGSKMKEIESGADVIYATTDAGSRWRKLSTNLVSDGHEWRLLDIWPVSKNSAWVVGDIVLQCNVAGNNCTEIRIGEDVYGVPSTVQFIDTTIGWIMTNQGNKYLVTIDQGKSWEVRSAPTENGGFKDLVYASSVDAWGILSDGIYQSKDGGKSWTKVVAGKYSSIQYLKSINTVFAVGDRVVKHKIP